MRRPEQSPSIVPPSNDQNVYLVLEDFSDWLGQAWRETDVEDTNLVTLLRHFLEGQYSNPIRIVAFNTSEGWSRTSPKMWPRCCSCALRNSRTIWRPRCGNSLTATRTRNWKCEEGWGAEGEGENEGGETARTRRDGGQAASARSQASTRSAAARYSRECGSLLEKPRFAPDTPKAEGKGEVISVVGTNRTCF